MQVLFCLIPKEQTPTFKKIKALDLDDGTEYKDEKGELQGTVISKVGRGPNPDKVVVMDPKGEYNIVEPDEEVHIELDEGARAKKVHAKALNKITPRVKSTQRKVKRLARLNLKEAEEKLFEINFNQKSTINDALDSPIRCGFEAETIWPDIEGASDDVDNYSISQIDDEFGGVDWDSMGEGFTDWIYENKQEEYMDDAISEFVSEREDDEDFLNNFIENEGIEESDWDHVREDALRREYGDERFEEEGAEELSELYGYEDENWAREYVDEYRRSDFRSFLEELAGDDEDVRQAAYEEASENYDYDDWINDQWYSMTSFCEDYGIEVSGGSDLQEVANIMETWIEEDSAFHNHRPDTGGYAETSGDITEYAVETDSSIDGHGTGAEIISPVFTKPRNMLNEMKKFFEMIDEKGGETNRSTGLHVTMSWNGEQGGYDGMNRAEPNKAKIALLLGDKYLLQTFNRDGNSYARSQYDNLKKATEKLKGNMKDKAGFEQLEQTLDGAISPDKFQAIHFKSQRDGKSGTNLIEFRIGGGEDYHLDFDRVTKAVIRYATSMNAGYDDNKFREDYIKAAFKLINKLDDISSRDVDRVKEREDEIVAQEDLMVLDAVKTIISSEHYVDTVVRMANISESLQEYKNLSKDNADKEWKNKWKKYLKDTGKHISDLNVSDDLNRILSEAPQRTTGGPSVKAYIQPSETPPSIQSVKEKESSMDRLAVVLGQLSNDIQVGTARSKGSAKTIGAFRNFFKRYDISYEDIAQKVVEHSGAIQMHEKDRTITAQIRISRIKAGLEQLLKKDIITLPPFLKNNDVEVLVNAMWNMVNSDISANKLKTEIEKLVSAISEMRPDKNRLDIDHSVNSAKGAREFNDFYTQLMRGSYHSNGAPFETGIQYNEKGYKKALKLVSKYPTYDEPVGVNYNQNMYSDDSYEDNFLSKYMMKLRQRLEALDSLKDENLDLYLQTAKGLAKPLQAYLKYIQDGVVDPDEPSTTTDYATKKFIEGTNKILDGVKNGGEDIDGRSFGNATTHIVTDYMRNILMNHYRAISDDRDNDADSTDELSKKDFLQLKLLMESWDKIFTKTLNYPSQQATIDLKKRVIQSRDDFKNLRATKPVASVNVPFYSNVYMDRNIWNEIKDEKDIDQINRYTVKDIIEGAQQVGTGNGAMFVIPAVHYSAVEDAINGSKIVDIQMKQGNDSQAWRLPKYKATLKAFYKLYGKSWEELENREQYTELDGDNRRKISRLFKIEFTKDGDGREGMGTFDTLIPKEEMQNPKSGEPISHTSMWSMNTPDAEKKRFNAYDWSQRTEQFKADVLKQMQDQDETFTSAMTNVVQRDNEKAEVSMSSADSQGLLQAAGVDGNDDVSSYRLEQQTNWVGLANFLGIEDGVDSQGSRLLLKVYQNFDDEVGRYSDENNENPMIGRQRYITIIKDAHKYITQNYKVSGGNYFRDGDDVSGVYSSTLGDDMGAGVTPDSYETARQNHTLFNNMMVQGINYYVQRDQVNNLVGFLNNSGNAMTLKDAVLQAITRNKEAGSEPLDYDSALNLGLVNHGGWQGNNESVFAKFDKLPLQEQLDILNKVSKNKIDKLYEAIDDKEFKATLDKKDQRFMKRFDKNQTSPSDPFDNMKQSDGEPEPHSDKQNPEKQMLKVLKNKKVRDMLDSLTHSEKQVIVLRFGIGGGKDYTLEQVGKIVGLNREEVRQVEAKALRKLRHPERSGDLADTIKESVPTIKTIKILNDLLADHFPVGDLKKQMLAFQAIPIPAMLDQFRELRAEAGDDACARGIVRYYINALPKEQQDKINLHEWSKSKITSLIESKGIMGRVLGDIFLNGDDKLEFNRVDLYPQEEMQFDSPEQRDEFVNKMEQELGSQIEWSNTPNNGSLAFGVATLTDPVLDDKLTYWGRYFKQKTADMMGKWSNSQVPVGWKLQTAGAMKLDIGIDPQHLIKTDDPFNGVTDVIQAVKLNSTGHELSEMLTTALETIHTQEHPVFPGQIGNMPALRDYFGEIMGPVALMSEMVGGQADAAKADLLKGQPWASCSIFWPMAMNAPLVDSYFTAPDGTRVGISSKGGKGAKASVKNIQDAILKAPDEMKAQYQTTVNVVNIVQSNSAKDGPFRLAELYRILPQGLEQEINGYIQEGKQDYAGLSPACTELFNYGTPRQDVPGFNTGYAMLALLAKKVTRAINTAGPEFGQGCVAFLNQSSIVQLYCKMGKNGQDTRVTGWEAVYPPNFQGTVEIDGSKNYYSSRIGGKFAFGFK